MVDDRATARQATSATRCSREDSQDRRIFGFCCFTQQAKNSFLLHLVPELRDRDAVEAWDDGDAVFNDGESPFCLAHRLCRASFAGFDSGRALLAGGVTGV